MKSLKTLIKIHRHKLDELRRDMVSLESKCMGLEQAIARLQQELIDEAELAGNSPEVRMFLGEFTQRINQRQKLLREEIAKLEEKMESLRAEISEAFSEAKKYEIALENAQKRKFEEEKRKENIEMSDIAIAQYQRRTQEGND